MTGEVEEEADEICFVLIVWAGGRGRFFGGALGKFDGDGSELRSPVYV